MSYEKLGFEKGQVLKAEHLNHIEDGIANIDNKVIILETTNRYNNGNEYYYNGENVDGEFVLDCLLSGYQFVVKYSGNYFSVYSWKTDYNGKKMLYLSTRDGSLCPEFELPTE